MSEEKKVNLASHPTTEDNATWHLQLHDNEAGGYALLPGSPERTLQFKKIWDKDSFKENAYFREFKSVSGKYKGEDIFATSTGCGGVGAELAIHELNEIGVHTCIRVGTTGCIKPEFDLGDLIIPYACIRRDGTSDCYADPSFPAVANIRVVMALMEACDRLGYKYGLGIGYTPASFYLGQQRKLKRDGGGYWPSWADNIIPDLQSMGCVTNIETDSASQFVVGTLHGMRMGTIVSVISNRVLDRWGDNGGEEKACRAATEAVYILKQWEKEGIF